MRESISDTETEHVSVEGPLNMHWTASNETTLLSEIPNIIPIIALGLRKKTVSVLNDEFCEEQVFPYLLPKDKFGYNAPRDLPISPARYFNQRFVSIASDVHYLFFAGLCINSTTYFHQ